MQEIFVNIFHKFDFERQKMAEEKQGGKIITPLGWDIKKPKQRAAARAGVL